MFTFTSMFVYNFDGQRPLGNGKKMDDMTMKNVMLTGLHDRISRF